MRRFKHILVVAVAAGDEPPPALREAVSLARESGARLRMVGLDDVNGSRLASWADAVGEPDLAIDVVSTRLPAEVVRLVDDHGHDLVLIARDDSGESTTLANRVLRLCPCPVWLCGPGATAKRVLAAVDPAHDDDRNRLLLELAASQAALHHGELRVMHAWQFAPGTCTATEAEDLHRHALAVTVERARLGVEPHLHLVDGPPARAVRGLGVLYRSDLVVIGAGADHEPELGIGSTTEQVLAESSGSVLVVR